MFVVVDEFSEEAKINKIKNTEPFKKGNFFQEYHNYINLANNVLEASKVFILENFEKITDWAPLRLIIYGYGDESILYGMKDEEYKRRKALKPKKIEEERPKSDTIKKLESLIDKSHVHVINPRYLEMHKEIDDETIQIEKIHDVVYDWVDGDFSLSINDRSYMWIDHNNPSAVIEIAQFIEESLNKKDEH